VPDVEVLLEEITSATKAAAKEKSGRIKPAIKAVFKAQMQLTSFLQVWVGAKEPPDNILDVYDSTAAILFDTAELITHLRNAHAAEADCRDARSALVAILRNDDALRQKNKAFLTNLHAFLRDFKKASMTRCRYLVASSLHLCVR
jgi:hypothetical protein